MGDSLKIEKLLGEVGEIMNIYKENGTCFNIFEVTGIAEKPMCKFLAQLLNPEGAHHQRDKYLKLFVKNVLIPKLTDKLKKELGNEDLSQSSVDVEYSTTQGRRIDIVLKTPGFFIAFEVKIAADEQDGQCFDYQKSAEESGKNALLFYLTIEGTPPSEKSAKDLKVGADEGEIKLLSWKKDIFPWVKECHKRAPNIPLQESLRQFESAVRKISCMNGKMEAEISEILDKDQEAMESALAIHHAISEVGEHVARKIIATFKEKTNFENFYDGHEFALKRRGHDLEIDSGYYGLDFSMRVNQAKEKPHETGILIGLVVVKIDRTFISNILDDKVIDKKFRATCGNVFDRGRVYNDKVYFNKFWGFVNSYPVPSWSSEDFLSLNDDETRKRVVDKVCQTFRDYLKERKLEEGSLFR
jgi:hypothetical protein